MTFVEITEPVTVVISVTSRGKTEISFSPGNEYPAPQLHDDFAVVEVTAFGERRRVQIPRTCCKIRELFVA